MELVTGFQNKSHITSAQDGSRNASMVGLESYVMATGEQFAASATSNNIVKILDGDAMHQGRHILIEKGSYEEVEISNGLTGLNRNDLIVIRYAKDANTGIEQASLVVIQGTSTDGTASDPEYNSGSILDNDILVDMPLYRVRIEGISVVSLDCLFEVVEPLSVHSNDTDKHITPTERKIWNAKQDAITGAATTITSNNLTANRVLITNASGKVGVSGIATTILNFLTGLKSNVQTQIDSKLGNAYNLLIYNLQSTTWKNVCVLDDYTLYIIEVLDLDNNFMVNSAIHFMNTLSAHATTNPVKVVNPENTAEYVQVCVNNGKLLFMTNGSVFTRIIGIK